MKKIITICVVSILMLTGAAKATQLNPINLNPSPSASLSVWVKIILTFHRPKLDCKSGFGICVDIEVGMDKATGSGANLCPAQARLNAAGQFELRVTEEDLQKYENGFALPYFSRGSITLEDSYTFSDPVTRQLGTDREITVKPGSYKVVYDALTHTYTVALPY